VVKDLCQKLFILDPNARIGAGRPNFDNSFKKLKAHPFFKGVDFKNIFNRKSHISMSSKEFVWKLLLSAAIDATTDDSIKEEIKSTTS